MEWINVNKELPPINTIVKVRLVNGCEAYDYVNEPVNYATPFQHYIVTAWRSLTSEECNELVVKIRK